MVFAAECAEKLMVDFERFYIRTMKAVNPGKPENPSDVSIADDAAYTHYLASFDKPLKAVLENLILEEANRKMKILAVDDAPVILKTISVALSNEYKVYTLSNPLFVEKFLEQITPELFLLDYKMPGLNGFELIPIIRKFEEHKDTPIIFLTSMGTNDYVSAAAMLGASDFVIKPFQGNVLREKIAKHIVRTKLF
jgi:PleD family two-component response regulator